MLFLILFGVWFVGAVVYYSLMHYMSTKPRAGAEEFHRELHKLSPVLQHTFLILVTLLWPIFVSSGVFSLVREKVKARK